MEGNRTMQMKNILWDLDGTITDSQEGIIKLIENKIDLNYQSPLDATALILY